MTLDPYDTASLVKGLQSFADDPAAGKQMGKKGQERVRHYDINNFGTKAMEAVRYLEKGQA